MNYFRRTLPSLDALVFFESAARLQNYTHAAEELHVTQVAVSKRVRALEADLGVRLFQRVGRSIALTPEGRDFAERIRAGLAFLEDSITGARGVSTRRRQVIHIAANENMNFFWLAPLVRDFQIAGNDAVVSVVTANNVTDVVRSDTDLAIFYCKSPPDGWLAHELFEEIIAPVASRSYALEMEAGEIPTITLLEYTREAPDWTNWETLLHAQGGHWFPATQVRHCSSYIQSISLALEGAGVALGVLPLLSEEIRSGRLAVLGERRSTRGHRYFLATPESKRTSDATGELIALLLQRSRDWRVGALEQS